VDDDVVELTVSDVRVAVPAGNGVEAGLVLLREMAAPNRILRMYVGQAEARAIHVPWSNGVPLRPSTWDLFVSTVSLLDARIERVIISDVQEERHYFAQMLVHRAEMPDPLLVTARPSDAIALALRAYGCKIYARPHVLDEAGVLADGTRWERPEPEPEPETVAAADVPVGTPSYYGLPGNEDQVGTEAVVDPVSGESAGVDPASAPEPGPAVDAAPAPGAAVTAGKATGRTKPARSGKTAAGGGSAVTSTTRAKKRPAVAGTAAETPATVVRKTPAAKTPAAKTPAAKTPAAKTPAVRRIPAAKAAAVEKNPAAKAAADKKIPAAKTAGKAVPVTGSVPSTKAPARKTPATKTPATKTPATKTPATKTPGEPAT
jgi:bifunctional DNase/RNase